MDIIRSVSISGIWGEKLFSLTAHPDVNFLVGVNGTGKTTAINLIAASLNADFNTLDQLAFERIRIELMPLDAGPLAAIEVRKEPRKDLPFPNIEYRISDDVSLDPSIYSLDSFEEQRAFREYPMRYRLRTLPGIIEHLKRLVNVSWLSIHRAEPAKSSREDRSFESTVDRKLDQVSTDLGKYLSSLTSKGNIEMAKFQEKVFLSLISVPGDEKSFLGSSRQDNIKIDQEKAALIDIFRQFKLDEATFRDNVDRHFKILKTATENLKKSKSIQPEQLVALVLNERIDSLAIEWEKLIREQQRIYEPRQTFLDIVNGMLYRKQLQITEKNEFVALTSSGKLLMVSQLSSGEKQLMIILGEALLQQKSPWIYIADEPELSLHVTWQSQLIDGLRNVNPNAQIIVATHSPDIVGKYDNRVFDMEEALQ